MLTRTEATLPSHWYYDPAHYERELDAIWYRDWICIGRVDDLLRTGDFLLATVGTQSLIATRDSEHGFKVFHNTCRHRGSALCTTSRGRFANGRIVCPYHTWTYSLSGDLLATPVRVEASDFRMRDYSLYEVNADVWGGFLFVNLSTDPPASLIEFLGAEARELANWPLSDLVSVHREEKTLACNWKLFWENYSECYHCPRLHPELCRIVPLYRQGVLNYADTSDVPAEEDSGRPHVGSGKKTWTLDGQSSLPWLDGPNETERARGMTFASFTGSMFVVAHPDYVRSVRIYPKGPEETELIVDWLLPRGTREEHPDQVDSMLALGRLVIEQDSRACELNQQGLRSRRHEHGVLVPQEYVVWEFHNWLRQRLG